MGVEPMRLLRGASRGRAGGDHGIELHRRQLARKLRRPLDATVSVAALEDEVLALDIALLAQALQERLFQMAALRQATADQDADMCRFFR